MVSCKSTIKTSLSYVYIGSRYFVTASNDCLVIFLKNAAIEYLNFTGKSTGGNKLERVVFSKPLELAHLKTDCLIFITMSMLICIC